MGPTAERSTGTHPGLIPRYARDRRPERLTSPGSKPGFKPMSINGFNKSSTYLPSKALITGIDSSGLANDLKPDLSGVVESPELKLRVCVDSQRACRCRK